MKGEDDEDDDEEEGEEEEAEEEEEEVVVVVADVLRTVVEKVEEVGKGDSAVDAGSGSGPLVSISLVGWRGLPKAP